MITVHPPPPPVVHKDAKQLTKIILTGSFMGVVAGFINAVCIMSVLNTTVSHVSGTTTRLGMLIVQSQTDKSLMPKLWSQFYLILFFFLGYIYLPNCRHVKSVWPLMPAVVIIVSLTAGP